MIVLPLILVMTKMITAVIRSRATKALVVPIIIGRICILSATHEQQFNANFRMYRFSS